MLYYLLYAVVVILAVAIFIILRNRNGGNYAYIASNIAGIYAAISNCKSAKKLNEEQRCFLTCFFYLMAYINDKKIKLETISEISKKVARQYSEDTQKLVCELSAEIMIRMFLLSSKAEYKVVLIAIERNYEKIAKAVNQQLSLGTEGKICQKWLPMAEQYINDPKWIAVIKSNLKEISE